MADRTTLGKLEACFKNLDEFSDCKSLLKRHLSRELFDKLKNRVTSLGVTLYDVIRSGAKNRDATVGAYAPDVESYRIFAPLFDPIIEEYHMGFKTTDKHPRKDFGDTTSIINIDPENKFVISTRIRCARSLLGYPFSPCLTKEQFKEIESKISSALTELRGELKGTYYPLVDMTNDEQKKLIKDHFLFRDDDHVLQESNVYRHWPIGRGIFYNDKKTALAWINEEDHLRIISMQMGSDLRAVYQNFITFVEEMDKRIPFCRDDHLGFLTFCPSNLGTTIRTSVLIKLPKLGSDMQRLKEVGNQLNLQIRGTYGSYTEVKDGVCDISNKRRLGLTEFQVVKEMQEGILKLIEMEEDMS